MVKLSDQQYGTCKIKIVMKLKDNQKTLQLVVREKYKGHNQSRYKKKTRENFTQIISVIFFPAFGEFSFSHLNYSAKTEN
jgi:hypothetical protein